MTMILKKEYELRTQKKAAFLKILSKLPFLSLGNNENHFTYINVNDCIFKHQKAHSKVTR